jgi:hypothetical protein
VFKANDDGWSQKVPNNGFEEQPHSKGQLPRGLPLSSSRVEQIFPKLTPAQITRIAMHGHLREIQRGEVLVEQGDSAVPFLVVISGELEIVRPSGAAETLTDFLGYRKI